MSRAFARFAKWVLIAAVAFGTAVYAPDATAQGAGNVSPKPSQQDKKQSMSNSSGINLQIDLGDKDSGQLMPALKIVLLMLFLTLLPAILVSVTSFTRIIIVIGFLKQALGTKTLPPGQVIIGLSLFLTLFTMSPVLEDVHSEVVEPYQNGKISDMQAMQGVIDPLRKFMAEHTRPKDLQLFLDLTKKSQPKSFESISTFVLIPSFMLSELRTAFIMGAMIYIPFIIIDVVVASLLMSMGMMMVPPIMISLPIKILLFVLADGWNLVIGSLARSIVG